jgi:hypothetical protein
MHRQPVNITVVAVAVVTTTQMHYLQSIIISLPLIKQVKLILSA